MSIVPIKQFGSEGKDNGQFNRPYGICYDSKHQHILVSDQYNHRIQIFNDNGDYVSSFGSEGSEDGQFQCPNQINIHPLTNNIFVADSANHRIQIFNDEGKFLLSFRKDILCLFFTVSCSRYSPYHVVTADYLNQIHLFASSPQSYQLLRSFCSTGRYINCREDQTNGVYGLCSDDENKRILVCDHSNKRLSVWSSDGSQFINTIPIINKEHPSSVYVDYSSSNNNSHYFMVGTENTILVYDARKDDQVIETIESDDKYFKQFGAVYGLCTRNDDGGLMAIDWVNHGVKIFANQRMPLMNTLLIMGLKPSSSKRQKIVASDSFSFMNNQLYDPHLMGVIASYLPFYYSY